MVAALTEEMGIPHHQVQTPQIVEPTTCTVTRKGILMKDLPLDHQSESTIDETIGTVETGTEGIDLRQALGIGR
jgi:hypothetical protein